MKRKTIKSLISLSVVIIIFVVFIVVKGAPMIAVSKVETALNNKDGVLFTELYNKYIKNRTNTLIGECTFDSVTDYMAEWVKPVASDFNQHFSNFETQEEMDSYLKNKYNNIFFNEKSNQILKYSGFDDLYLLRDSKIKSLDIKKELDEKEREINNIKNMIDNLYKLSDIPIGNAVMSQRDAELVTIYGQLSDLDLYFYISEPYILSDCLDNDTLYGKLETKILQLKNELNELQNEYDKY